MNPWARLQSIASTSQKTGSFMECQRIWLQQCLARNWHSEIGQAYGFSTIDSLAKYQRYVPVCSYDDLKPAIDRIAGGEDDVLFAGKPCAFELTSGTTSSSRLIPYTAESLDDFKNAVLPWLANLVMQYGLSSGRAYWSISPATREVKFTDAGYPIGLHEAQYLGDEAAALLGQLCVVPEFVSRIRDVNTWQLLTLYYLVRAEDLELISVWSPTFLLSLLSAMTDRYDELVTLLENGYRCEDSLPGVNITFNIATDIDAGIDSDIDSDREAVRRLKSWYQSGKFADVWPNLKLVSCWADAASRVWYDELKGALPGVSFQAKGLLATECVVTVPDIDNQPLLVTDSGFHEFETEKGDILLADQLTRGQTYRLIVTTSGGLYRYRLNDCVRCDGYRDDVPMLTFVGRAGVQSDLVGEKLTETFVEHCLQSVSGFRMLVAGHTGKRGYTLYIDANSKQDGKPIAGHQMQMEKLAATIEQKLSDNPHYQYARKMGQLAPLSIGVIVNAIEQYTDYQTKRGTRLADVKIPVLCNHNEWLKTNKESVYAHCADFT